MGTLALFNQTITNERTQKYLAEVLRGKKDAFVNNLTALVANNEMLQECEPLTLMYAGIKATALNVPLDNNLGYAYVLPYRDNKKGKTVAQLQFGYKLFNQLAVRSGQYKRINVTDVRKGELKGRDRRTGEIKFEWIEDDTLREQTEVIGYYAYFQLHNGYEKEVYLSVAEIDAHGKRYSQTYRKGFGVWKDNFDAMAKKTMYKKLFSGGDAPLSIEMQQAVKYDQSVIVDEQGTAEYADNEPMTAEETSAEEVSAEANQEEVLF